MFKQLQARLDATFSALKRNSKITEKDIESAFKSVKMALLEADVNFKVVKDLCTSIAEKAKGENVLKSLSPDQQVIKIVHEELLRVVGSGFQGLDLSGTPPFVIMMVGLQGSGKTTSTAKLGLYLRRELKKKSLLVPADVYRPAAILQLQKLGRELSIDVYPSEEHKDPVQIAKSALEYARGHLYDVMIIDTAGRLQIDAELMDELKELDNTIKPHEVLFVADAMTGQEAVNVAEGFNNILDIDGIILTKLDGDGRGGAALSMRAVIDKPIKFVGTSEKPDGLEVFHPERFVQRVLGMGDILTLIEKAERETSAEEADKLKKKFQKNNFNLQDFLEQYKKIQRMGSLQSIMGMIPGMDKMSDQIDFDAAEKEAKRVEAIVLSMTLRERRQPDILDGSRRRRIASGSGTSVQEVNALMNQFGQMKKMMHKLSTGGIGSLMNSFMGSGMNKGLKSFFR
jgi:signal recognition particle subunit SRP54